MTDKQIIVDEINKTIGQEMENLRNIAKQQIGKLEAKLKAKEQECEELKKDLHKNFEEKDKLHLIIDRLLEASGYDTNTASAEDFEDVYENMRYEKQQLDQLKQTLAEIKEICNSVESIENINSLYDAKLSGMYLQANKILQKISENEVEND